MASGQSITSENYSLNRVLSKSIHKTHQIRIGKKPSVALLHGLRKINPRTISCYFMGYPNRSKVINFTTGPKALGLLNLVMRAFSKTRMK